jgi:hypothetical protein
VTGEILVAFVSLNQVHRVRRKLMADGLYLDLVRVPKSTGLPGCGYGVRVSRNELDPVREVAEGFGIAVAGIFIARDGIWTAA